MPATTSSTQRPSRLLNLTKSPALMKRIAKANAASSPFLRLPAEVRSRIYDFALGKHTVHIYRARYEDTPYALAMCQCPDECEFAPPTRASACTSEREVYSLQPGASPLFLMNKESSHICLIHREKRMALSSDLPLHLLATCRQIYHEAVLRPFSQISFICDAAPLGYDYLAGFLNALVPAQARAIVHLRLMARVNNFPRQYTIKKLGQLKRFHVTLTSFELLFYHKSLESSLSYVLHRELQILKDACGFNAIRKLRVSSLHVDYEAGLYSLEGNYSEATATAMIKWLEDAEARLLQPAT